MRSDADHTAAVQRVDHMLASLSAETELAALGGDAGSAAPPAQEAEEAAARAPQSMPSSSTSKTRVLAGGMIPG